MILIFPPVHWPDNVWLTPAYQGKKYAHEAVFLLLRALFDARTSSVRA